MQPAADRNVVSKPRQPDDTPPMTRDCVSPWAGAEVHVNGSVGPCCILPDYGGNLQSNSLLEIIDGPRFRDLRRALLQGNLAESHIPAVRNSCSRCQLFGEVPVAVLRERVRKGLLRTEVEAVAVPE